jgi:hypothetical protein
VSDDDVSTTIDLAIPYSSVSGAEMTSFKANLTAELALLAGVDVSRVVITSVTLDSDGKVAVGFDIVGSTGVDEASASTVFTTLTLAMADESTETGPLTQNTGDVSLSVDETVSSEMALDMNYSSISGANLSSFKAELISELSSLAHVDPARIIITSVTENSEDGSVVVAFDIAGSTDVQTDAASEVLSDLLTSLSDTSSLTGPLTQHTADVSISDDDVSTTIDLAIPYSSVSGANMTSFKADLTVELALLAGVDVSRVVITSVTPDSDGNVAVGFDIVGSTEVDEASASTAFTTLTLAMADESTETGPLTQNTGGVSLSVDETVSSEMALDIDYSSISGANLSSFKAELISELS